MDGTKIAAYTINVFMKIDLEHPEDKTFPAPTRERIQARKRGTQDG